VAASKGKGEKMISLRFAVSAVLVAAAFAGCLTYFVTPPPQVEADEISPPSRETLAPDFGTPPKFSERLNAEKSGDAFGQAADAILQRAPDAQASADEPPPITGHVPLPKRRPIPRP
jgi:hypothetical protein